MKQFPLTSEEKFFRNFDKTVTFSTPLSRFRLCDHDCIAGSRRGKRICMYRKKKGVFALFSTTLYGSLLSDQKCIRYGFFRPIGSLICYLLWCAAMIAAGLSLLPDSVETALWFLLSAFLLLLPVFVFSRKEKNILRSALEEMAHPSQDEERDEKRA